MREALWRIILLLIAISVPIASQAADLSLAAITVQDNPAGGQTYSVSLQILAVMTVMTLLPTFLLMMTSFTRIIIVLAILRQAMGLPQVPTNQIILGLSLFLTFFIMAPIFKETYNTAINPYINDQLAPEQALSAAQKPFREFMLLQTRQNDLALFMKLSKTAPATSYEQIPFTVLVPAFLTSELKTAFQIGFILFIPFLMIDLVVASILMAMGMMMLSPIIISLPFKIMLFVLIDGWTLILGTLATSFGT